MIIVTAEIVRQDFEVVSAELKRRREELEEVETFAYSARISGYGRLTGRPAEKADRSEIRLLALERRRQVIAKLEQGLERDISRIEGCFKGWEESQAVLRLRFVQGMSVDEAIEAIYNVRRFECGHWTSYKRQVFRLEERAFQEISRQVK